MKINNRIGSRKAQSAMEYLMTYGWAILIIGIALAAMFQMGLFNPSKYVMNTCTLPSGLTCGSFFLYSNGTLSVSIGNSLQDPINVTAIGCSPNKTITNMQTPYNPPSNQIYIPIGGSYTFSVNCNGASGLAPGQLYTGYLVINYTDDVTLFPQTIFGRIAVKIS
ncbi:MAG: hypothetical protein RXP92_02875 [Candidatus Micrarchaeota archaeon]